MDNHSDMNASYELRPEGIDASLNELGLLHRQSITYYKDIAEALISEYESPAGFFKELARYHEKMLAEINDILSGMSAGVHTPSRTGQTALKKRERALNQAVISKNVTELGELAHENEIAVSEAYQHALGNPNVKAFKDRLEKQHENILVWVNRADRFKTVPENHNEHYDPDRTEV